VKVLLLMLAALHLTSVEFDTSGTFVVMTISQNRAIIAADSRVTIGPEVTKDDQCKIAAIKDKFVIATAGRTGHGSPLPGFSWDSITVARNVIADLKLPLNINQVAIQWAEQVTALTNRDAQRDVIAAENINDSDILSALLVGADGRSFSAFRIRIRKINAAAMNYTYTVERLDPREWKIYPLGRIDIASEFVLQQSQRSQAWMQTFHSEHPGASWDAVMPSLGQLLVNLTATYSSARQFVGGATDVIEITGMGSNWLQRKENCPKD
jgi:hypothetical protein